MQNFELPGMSVSELYADGAQSDVRLPSEAVIEAEASLRALKTLLFILPAQRRTKEKQEEYLTEIDSRRRSRC